MNEKKIATMTELALYDRKYAQIDKKRLEYFRDDYVYKKNMWIRLYVFIGTLILLVIDYCAKFFVYLVDPFSMNFTTELHYVIRYIIIVMIIYTVIGSIKHNYEYTISENRMEKYSSLVNKLEKINTKSKQLHEPGEVTHDGKADIL